MNDWQSTGDVIANGIRIHYYRTGGNKPPVVFSHGQTDSGECWPRVVAALRDEYDVITYDARGHGRSEAPEHDYSADARAADLAGLVRALGLDRPRLVGHSMGAETTSYCAAAYPELTRGVVLEDPPFWPGLYSGSDADRAAAAAAFRVEIEARRVKSHAEIVAEGKAENPKWADEEFEGWANAKIRLSPYMGNRRRDMPRRNWQSTFAAIQCPVLLITADAALGARITPEVEHEAASLLKNGRVVNIPGAGHNVRREQFDAYIVAVRKFLAEL
jgi:pimeloyl-ACP methyl ester carboxylesterase